MIAQRNWFSAAPRFPWPIHWKAWSYFAGCGALLVIPWAVLVARQHVLESVVWPWAVAALMFLDLRAAFRVPTAAPIPSAAPSGPPPVEDEIQYIETPRYLVRKR